MKLNVPLKRIRNFKWKKKRWTQWFTVLNTCMWFSKRISDRQTHVEHEKCAKNRQFLATRSLYSLLRHSRRKCGQPNRRSYVSVVLLFFLCEQNRCLNRLHEIKHALNQFENRSTSKPLESPMISVCMVFSFRFVYKAAATAITAPAATDIRLWFHGNRFQLNHSHSNLHMKIKHGYRMRDCYIKIKCKTKKCSWNTIKERRLNTEQRKKPYIESFEIHTQTNSHIMKYKHHIVQHQIFVWTIDCETVPFICIHLYRAFHFTRYFINFNFFFLSRIVSFTKYYTNYELMISSVRQKVCVAHGIPIDEIKIVRLMVHYSYRHNFVLLFGSCCCFLLGPLDVKIYTSNENIY